MKSCKETGKCAVYTCNFNSNWPREEFRLINVNMTFNGAQAEVGSYTVCTHLQVENKGKGCQSNIKLIAFIVTNILLQKYHHRSNGQKVFKKINIP